ncbi:MAG: type II toxin-antitoxin system PemK/MazF family toxin [Alphaproteobacteria bacterium]|nr:type II toxin-antitoxin system PemK/MazF family toxin [Alphaproteobacteria bacterium]
MTVCDAGDVAIVPFPFADIAIAKPRPALALSAREANESNGATLFAMITTAARSRWPSDIPLTDGAAAGLSNASLVRLKLFTLDNRLVSRAIGALSARDRASVRKMLKSVLTI